MIKQKFLSSSNFLFYEKCVPNHFFYGIDDFYKKVVPSAYPEYR